MKGLTLIYFLVKNISICKVIQVRNVYAHFNHGTTIDKYKVL